MQFRHCLEDLPLLEHSHRVIERTVETVRNQERKGDVSLHPVHPSAAGAIVRACVRLVGCEPCSIIAMEPQVQRGPRTTNRRIVDRFASFQQLEPFLPSCLAISNESLSSQTNLSFRDFIRGLRLRPRVKKFIRIGVEPRETQQPTKRMKPSTGRSQHLLQLRLCLPRCFGYSIELAYCTKAVAEVCELPRCEGNIEAT